LEPSLVNFTNKIVIKFTCSLKIWRIGEKEEKGDKTNWACTLHASCGKVMITTFVADVDDGDVSELKRHVA